MNKQLSETFSSVVKKASADMIGKEIDHELQHTIELDLESCSKIICNYEGETLAISIDQFFADSAIQSVFPIRKNHLQM